MQAKQTVETQFQYEQRRTAVNHTTKFMPRHQHESSTRTLQRNAIRTSDEQLAKAFSAYGSFAKARVVRDKKTMKSKGYGFVSMMDSMDFAKAMKEVHGKWIGSRPCKLRKSSWEERNDQTAANSHSKRKGGGKNLGGLGEFAGGKRKKGGGYGLKHSRKHLAVAPSIEKYKAKNK